MMYSAYREQGKLYKESSELNIQTGTLRTKLELSAIVASPTRSLRSCTISPAGQAGTLCYRRKPHKIVAELHHLARGLVQPMTEASPDVVLSDDKLLAPLMQLEADGRNPQSQDD
jgi:hypothetical protein